MKLLLPRCLIMDLTFTTAYICTCIFSLFWPSTVQQQLLWISFLPLTTLHRYYIYKYILFLSWNRRSLKRLLGLLKARNVRQLLQLLIFFFFFWEGQREKLRGRKLREMKQSELNYKIDRIDYACSWTWSCAPFPLSPVSCQHLYLKKCSTSGAIDLPGSLSAI